MKLVTPIKKMVGMSRDNHGQQPDADSRNVHYDVPFISQSHINLCGDACVTMLLEFNGKEPTVGLVASRTKPGVMKLVHNPRGVLEAAETADLVRTLRDRDLKTYEVSSPTGRVTGEQMFSALGLLGPIIAAVAFSRFCGHYILLTGVQINGDENTDKIFYHDSWRGSHMSMTVAHFNQICESEYAETLLGAPADYVHLGGLRMEGLNAVQLPRVVRGARTA